MLKMFGCLEEGPGKQLTGYRREGEDEMIEMMR